MLLTSQSNFFIQGGREIEFALNVLSAPNEWQNFIEEVELG